MATRNTIQDLRNHLFATLEDLRDRESGMDASRARAIVNVSESIINTAKVEIELLKAVSGTEPASRRFFGLPEESRELPPHVAPARIGGK